MKENAWRNMNAASRSSKRSSTWSTTWKRLPRSPEPCAVRHRSNSGGTRALARQSRSFLGGTEATNRKATGTAPWIDVLLLGRQYGYGFAQGSAGKGSGSEPFRCRGGAIAARVDLPPKER